MSKNVANIFIFLGVRYDSDISLSFSVIKLSYIDFILFINAKLLSRSKIDGYKKTMYEMNAYPSYYSNVKRVENYALRVCAFFDCL